MNSFNILFTSAGRRVSLIRLFRQALHDLGLTHRIITADLRRSAPAHHIADEGECVPRVTDPTYVDSLRRICQKHRVRLLVPLIDTELPLLAIHKADFQSIGTTILVSSPETVAIAADKRATDAFLHQHHLHAPRLLDSGAILAGTPVQYPILLKPADGSASAGVTKIHSARELAFFLDYVPNAIVQEYLEGDEYTLDVLVDFHGRVRCVVSRRRIETRAGEVSKGVTVRDPAIIDAGRRVVEALPGPVGCLTLQCIRKRDGSPVFIDLNPRFGGGFPLAAAAGADFPRWIIEWMIGRDPVIDSDGWRDGIMMLRYDEGIFVDRAAIASCRS
jgi:carbamoyl-phosphate synthase large subunit